MEDPLDDARRMTFSTARYRGRKGTEAWREIFGRTLLRIDVTPLSERFRAEASALSWRGFGMIDTSMSATHQANSRELIANDDLSFGSVSSLASPNGRWGVSQLGRNPELVPGDGVLLSNGDIGSVTMPSECRFVTFSIPRSALTALVPDAAAWVARPVPAASPEMRMLSSYLRLARDEQFLVTPELRKAFATHVVDLLALCIGPNRDAAALAKSRGLRAARLHAIKQDVQNALGRADLSVRLIADRHGVTPRYVQILFEESGATFSQFVLEQRLAAVYRTLTDSARSKMPISTIAYGAGFADLSNFNRAFRQRFGRTPSDVRAMAQTSGNHRG
jgi:AraC-like DNA-binding protein